MNTHAWKNDYNTSSEKYDFHTLFSKEVKASVSVCVCVCERERERERGGSWRREKNTDNHIDP